MALPPGTELTSLVAVTALVVTLGAGAVNAVGRTGPTTLGKAMNVSAASVFVRDTRQLVSRSSQRRNLVIPTTPPGEVWQLQEERKVRRDEVLDAGRAEVARVVKAAVQAAAAKKAAAAKVVSDAAAADAKAARDAQTAAEARAARDAAAAWAAGDDPTATTGATQGHPGPRTVPSTGIRAWAAGELTSMGYGPEQFTCLEDLWDRESGWSYLADNPRSDAYGIPQALPGNRMASAGEDWRTNPKTQITWGLGYIRDRYLTPCNAWAHSEALDWY
ncbi:MAG: lytic transglycosylase domain-containing protein [Actinomycetota bacterium]